MRRIVSVVGFLLAVAASALATVGCGPEPRVPVAGRGLAEQKAVEVIRDAVRASGVEPTDGRDVQLGGEGSPRLRVDVGIVGHQYGIAYVTASDAEALAGTLPARNRRDERLHVLRAGERG